MITIITMSVIRQRDKRRSAITIPSRRYTDTRIDDHIDNYDDNNNDGDDDNNDGSTIRICGTGAYKTHYGE